MNFPCLCWQVQIQPWPTHDRFRQGFLLAIPGRWNCSHVILCPCDPEAGRLFFGTVQSATLSGQHRRQALAIERVDLAIHLWNRSLLTAVDHSAEQPAPCFANASSSNWLLMYIKPFCVVTSSLPFRAVTLWSRASRNSLARWLVSSVDELVSDDHQSEGSAAKLGACQACSVVFGVIGSVSICAVAAIGAR